MIWDIVKKIKSLGPDARAVEVREEGHIVRFANNEVTTSNLWLVKNVGVELIKGRRSVILTIPGDDLERALRQIEQGIGLLEKRPEDPTPVFLKRREVKVSPPPWHRDPTIVERVDRLMDLLHSSIQAAQAEGASRVAGALTFGITKIHYVDTEGSDLEDETTYVTFTIRSFANGDITSTRVSVSRTLSAFNPVKSAVESASMVKEASKLPREAVDPGRYKVLLDPMVVASLVEYVIWYWFSAYNVLAGTSRFSREDLGKILFSDKLSVVDTATLENALGVPLFDFEGVKTRDVVLIDKGHLAGFLHNTRTAQQFGTESTGNALGVDGWVLPTPKHAYIKPGDSSLQELVEVMRDGIYICNNWYTRFQNVREGIFSTVARDVVFIVKNGKIKAITSRIRISDSMANLLKNVVGLGKEPEQVYWWDLFLPTTSPPILVDNLAITRA